MRSTKSQNTKHKQILITEILNLKHDIAECSQFGLLGFKYWILFDICYLVLVIYADRQRWFADRRTAKFLMRLEDGNLK